jgi:predicted ATP-dependent endonuclease of OLD family
MVHYLTPHYFDAHNMWDRVMSGGFGGTKGHDLFSGVEVINKIMSNHSQGESTIQILVKLYNLQTEYDAINLRANDLFLKSDVIFHEWLDSFPKEKGKPTLLIDEFDEHLDLDNQKIYWDYISKLTEKWQVIVVSHSIFAFRLKNVNHIKLNPEYFNKVNKL